MTEAEGLACADSQAMLGFRAGKISDRKIYLTASAFLRRFWHLIPDERSRRAVEAMERYADGLASWRALRGAQRAAKGAFQQLEMEERAKGILQGSFYDGRLAVAYYAAGLDVELRSPFPEQRVARPRPWLGSYAQGAAPAHYASDPYDYSGEPPQLVRLRRVPPETLFDVPRSVLHANSVAKARERTAQAELLRDLFGNPFRPIPMDPAWLRWGEGSVPKIAQAIYDERCFGDLPVLADALEDAGCTAMDILTHCRHPGEHVRGCWVIDLLLGKQ
jgi:hypothetical protein